MSFSAVAAAAGEAAKGAAGAGVADWGEEEDEDSFDSASQQSAVQAMMADVATASTKFATKGAGDAAGTVVQRLGSTKSLNVSFFNLPESSSESIPEDSYTRSISVIPSLQPLDEQIALMPMLTRSSPGSTTTTTTATTTGTGGSTGAGRLPTVVFTNTDCNNHLRNNADILWVYTDNDARPANWLR